MTPLTRNRTWRNRTTARRRLTAAVIACALLAIPSAANASYRTLGRSIGNILQAPLDLICSPVVVGMTLYRNLKDIDDTTGVRVAYTVPGYLWMLGVQVGASSVRTITGALQLIPGIFLLPFEADLDPLYDPVDNSSALVEWENGVIDVKFGIAYQGPSY
ncbi:MAG: hypothetical protein O7G30_16620 [Proteobacteria bacterium]|nr:hypothetical protein [Pseudomonadota bacterium]